MALNFIISNFFAPLYILISSMPILDPIYKTKGNFLNCYFKADQQK